MTPFYALLLADLFLAVIAVLLVASGCLTVSLRQPRPRKPPEGSK